jgi:hypothetical protein
MDSTFRHLQLNGLRLPAAPVSRHTPVSTAARRSKFFPPLPAIKNLNLDAGQIPPAGNC